MRKIILPTTFLFAFSGQLALGQNIKTYSGAYNWDDNIYEHPKGITPKPGKATYQYYENDKSQRLYNGSFSFTGTIPVMGNVFTINVNGEFKNNKKNGLWTSTSYIPLIKPIFTNKSISGYKQIATGKYKDGNKEGLWTVTETQNGTNKILSQLTGTYHDNYFVGVYEKKINKEKDYAGGKTINLQFKCSYNSNGLLDGDWIETKTIDGLKTEDKRKYIKGVLSSRLERDLTTGKILHQLDSIKFVTSFFAGYDSLTNFSLVNNIHFSIRNKKPNHYNNSDYTYKNKLPMFGIKDTIELTGELYIENTQNLWKQQGNGEYELQKQREEEAENKEQKKIEQFRLSDYGQIQSQIKRDFNSWLTKSEFETKKDYQTRIENKSDSIFKIISDSIISRSKTKYLKGKSANLESYDAEKEIYSVTIFNSPEVLTINIPRNIAPLLNKDVSVFPQDAIMQNNKWTANKAQILFTGFSHGISKSDFKIITEDSKLFGTYEAYGQYKFELENIKIVGSNKSSDKNVLYYPWEISEQPNYNSTNTQSLNFNYATLNIILPKF